MLLVIVSIPLLVYSIFDVCMYSNKKHLCILYNSRRAGSYFNNTVPVQLYRYNR